LQIVQLYESCTTAILFMPFAVMPEMSVSIGWLFK